MPIILPSSESRFGLTSALTAAGAKARSVMLGHRPKLTAHQKRGALERRERGDETLAEIGRSYNVSGWTISRLTA